MALALYAPIISNLSAENQNNLGGSELKVKLDHLITLIRKALISEENFSVATYSLFGEVFQLRASVSKLIAEHKINLIELYDTVSGRFNEQYEEINVTEKLNSQNVESPEIPTYDVPQNQILNVLVENVLFSIRTLKKVAKQLVNEDNTPGSLYFLRSISSDISYKELLNVLKSPHKEVNEQVAENIFNLFSSSLMLEISLFAANISLDEYDDKNITDEKINELSEIIANNAQLYGASALGLGIIGKRKSIKPYANLDEAEMTEQISVAESGIDDYLKMIDNE